MPRSHRRKKKREGVQGQSRDLLVGYYAVAFVDILNQKEKLSRITKLPTTDSERQEFIKQWKDSFGVVKGFRDIFDNFFYSFANEKSRIPRGATKEQKDLVRLVTKVDIQRECFSDTMMYYSWVTETSDRLGISATHALLSGCAATFLSTLSMGFVCRGGIEVGIGGEFAPGDLYGPALYHAHRLESEDAEYPRIAIGNGLLEFISMEMNVPGQEPVDAFRRGFAAKCKEWLIVDVDGVPILDHAGAPTKEILPQLGDAIDPAIAFVEREWRRFKSEGKTKLAGRYFMLRNYLRERKQTIWK